MRRADMQVQKNLGTATILLFQHTLRSYISSIIKYIALTALHYVHYISLHRIFSYLMIYQSDLFN